MDHPTKLLFVLFVSLVSPDPGRESHKQPEDEGLFCKVWTTLMAASETLLACCPPPFAAGQGSRVAAT